MSQTNGTPNNAQPDLFRLGLVSISPLVFLPILALQRASCGLEGIFGFFLVGGELGGLFAPLSEKASNKCESFFNVIFYITFFHSLTIPRYRQSKPALVAHNLISFISYQRSQAPAANNLNEPAHPIKAETASSRAHWCFFLGR